MQRLAWRAALAVAPDVAERRRTAAEKRRARVTVFREESGAVGLSGRDLPTDQALAGHANVIARAERYEASGAFPDHSGGTLQALAYLHLLRGVTVEDAIAFARTATAEPPDSAGHDQDDEDDDDDWDLGGEAGDGRSHGDDDDDDDDGPDDDGPDDDGSGGDDDDPGGGSGPDGDDDGPGGSGDRDGDQAGPGAAGGRAALPEVTAPLATLQRRAKRPGDNRLLGPLDPALTRDLATAAARSPDSRWEVTIVDDMGYATGHGTARPRRGKRHRQQPQPPPPGPGYCALPARVNITVTQTLLRHLAAQPRSGAPPGDWELALQTTGTAEGTWALTLPGGRELAVRFDAVPTHDCDHRHQVTTYQPSEKLRRLVQIRDHECTFPPCSRPAHESDFEHAIPYHKGGKTCGCNAGARSRRCHQVKQTQGWSVTQPKPGWHVWTTPTGRTYVQEPWRYIA